MSEDNVKENSAEKAEEIKSEATSESAAEKDEKQPVVEEKPAEPTLEEQLAIANDRYLRARAEFDNYRKRMAREALETREAAKCQVVGEFVNVYDYFQMALDQANKGADANVILEGIKMIAEQFGRTLDNLGVTAIDVTGQDFDPRFHEAISQECSEDVPEGKIIRQWKSLFKVGERLVRAATVVVSSGPAKNDKKAEAKESGEKA